MVKIVRSSCVGEQLFKHVFVSRRAVHWRKCWGAVVNLDGKDFALKATLTPTFLLGIP